MSPAFFNTMLVSAGVAWLAIVASANAAPGLDRSRATMACAGTQETWTFGPAIPPGWQASFQEMLRGAQPPARALSEALALRRASRGDPEARAFAEYWASRALLEAKMQHVAFAGFSAIASRPVDARTLWVQVAAVSCLERLLKRYPSMLPPQGVVARLPSYPASVRAQLAGFTLASYLHAIGFDDQATQARLIPLLEPSRAHFLMARGIAASLRGDYVASARALEPFFAGPRDDFFKPYNDQMRLVLARAYFGAGQFDKAAAQLKFLAKSSNELAQGLSELSWAYLLNEKYNEAIGAALSLQAGGMRNTFAPEGPMVMAMALNELCQYPDSLKSVNSFKKFYEKPYRWLRGWAADRKPLYPMAVKFLKRQRDPGVVPVPDRVGSEWVRSPVFISHQDEINLLFDERESGSRVGKTGAAEQKRLYEEARKLAKEVGARARAAREKAGPGQPLPPGVVSDLNLLKSTVAAYRRMREAAPVWRSVLTTHESRAAGLEKGLVDRINSELMAKSMKMHVQLEEIAENTQLVEVEIFNGASQDIIWQNAHPDYKKTAANMETAESPRAAEVWDWGRTTAGSEETAEVWEDELGSFKADVFDNCASKDRYLAIKRGR